MVDNSACPFHAGSMITNPKYFVGRDEALRYIATRMESDQPTSVNIVGEHRMGKSSLLYRFYQIWNPQQFSPRADSKKSWWSRRDKRTIGKDTKPYVVVYVDLQTCECQQEVGFYQAIATALQKHPKIQKQRQLKSSFKPQRWDRQTFSDAIKDCKAKGLLVVLCLDKFDGLFQYPEEFDNGFYDSLHSLMNHNQLMLVIATLESIKIYRDQKKLTSSFFNVGHNHFLKELTEPEANILVSLPQNETSALSLEKQKMALDWGRNHPYLLQLAGQYLWEAKQFDRPLGWAKEQFDRQAQSCMQPAPISALVKENWCSVLVTLRKQLLRGCAGIGKLTRDIGSGSSEFGYVVIGLFVLSAFVAVVMGNLTPQEFFNWFLRLIQDLLS